MLRILGRVFVLLVVTSSLSSVRAESPPPSIVGRWTFVDILDNGLLPAVKLQALRDASRSLTVTFEPDGRYVFFGQPMGSWTLDPDGKRVVVSLVREGVPPGTKQELLIERLSTQELVLEVGKLPYRLARFVPPPAAASPPPPPIAAREPTVFEKVAPTKLDTVADAAHRPASAYLHGLWLGGRAAALLPASVERWASPRSESGLNLDWSTEFAAPCDVVEAITRKFTPGHGWRVVAFHCGPSAGERGSIDVFETYTTREQVSPGVVQETTWRQKVRTDEFTYEARDAAVTIVVRAPLGDRELKIGVTRVVPSLGKSPRVAGDGLFAFSLRGPNHDLVRDLHVAYHKEADRLADAWLREAEEATDEDAREEALARSALLKPDNDAVAVAYFKRKYGLKGSRLKSLTPEAPPSP